MSRPFRYRQRVSRGSVWPRTHKAFSSRREARYRLVFSVLQAAKRNGGGIFVAFVRFGSSEKVKLHRCCQITRSIGRVPLHSVWRSGEMVAREGRCERVRRVVAREGTLAKRNLGLARARGLLKPALFVTASAFHGVPFGPVPTSFFRHVVRLVIAWFFRFCKRPNGMEVGFSLLSSGLAAAKKSSFTVVARSHAVTEAPPPFRLAVRGDGGSRGQV